MRYLNENSVYYRFTYKNIGIYEAWKIKVGFDKWKNILNSGVLSWLPKPNFYGKNNKSYFTKKGYKLFIRTVYPLIIKDLNRRDIKLEKIRISDDKIVYRDDYQIITEENDIVLHETSYDPPMSLKEIRQNYGENLYNKLKADPIHRWRAETGIELIHKEPSKQELIRIMYNWNQMPVKYKLISDKKSLELFGMTNKEHFKKLIKTYDNNSLNDFLKILRKNTTKKLVLDSNPNELTFIGIGKKFSIIGEDQYNTIGRFWDLMSDFTNKDDLIGFGCNWTKTDMEYYIGFIHDIDYRNILNNLNFKMKNLKIKKFKLDTKDWILYKGKTKNINKMYDFIWTDKVVTSELEFFTNNGNCYLLINKNDKVIKGE